jgi:5-methylcytosine-specific restriction endonuclease McrA
MKPFVPTVAEMISRFTRAGDQFRSISGACPEVAAEVFGYFASGLHLYADEIDHDLAHKRLSEEGVDMSDFRWHWSMVEPCHYTNCREYSIKLDAHLGTKNIRKPRLGLTAKVRWQVLARDAFTCQYCGRRPPEVSLEVDHRISVADGGTDDLDNLFSACTECNRGKGAQSVTENG